MARFRVDLANGAGLIVDHPKATTVLGLLNQTPSNEWQGDWLFYFRDIEDQLHGVFLSKIVEVRLLSQVEVEPLTYDCPVCEGAGVMPVLPIPHDPQEFRDRACWACAGQGQVDAQQVLEMTCEVIEGEEVRFAPEEQDRLVGRIREVQRDQA